MRRVAALVCLLSALACGSTAKADDARPVSFEIQETAPGRYDARFQTPMRGRRILKARPRLPHGSSLVPGSYERQVAGDSSIERFTFEIPDGLVGREIGVDGLVLGSRNAILRIRLRDGRDLRAVLGAARPVLRVEAPAAEARAPWTAAPRGAAVRGFQHGVLEPVHLLLAVGLVLAAKGGGWLLALGLFLLFDLAGAGLGTLLPAGLRLAPGLAEAFTALVACLVAREVLLGRTRRIALLAALAGLGHGLALVGEGRQPLEVVGHAFGLDLAQLLVGLAALALLALLGRPAVRRALAWTVGVLAVAAAGIAAARPDLAPVPSTERALLPTALAADAIPAGATTARAQGLVTALEAYLDVGVFGTRLEILARLRTLRTWLDSDAAFDDVLPVEDQPELLARLAASMGARLTITVDGEVALPDAVRTGFAVQEPTGTYLRDEPVEEDASTALVGVVYALSGSAIPNTVAVEWTDLPPGLSEVRARVIDPEISRETRIEADAPRLTWENTLREDPMPSVATTRVRRYPVPLPILSLFLLVLGLNLVGYFGRRRAWAMAGLGLRVGVALAFLALPFLTVDASAWLGGTPAPTPREARAITSALLENVYRAFNVREEEAVYDRLALSLTEASRTTAYMENRRALAFARVGGARTHVDVVELRSLDDLESTPEGGFAASAQWTVAGSVTHFGHRHLRQNVYRARLGLTPSDGTWKIDTFDVETIERRR